MSALAMILTAAMVIPGNGPKMEPGEIAKPQALDVSGSWEGIAWSDDTIWWAEVSNRALVLTAVMREATIRERKVREMDRKDVGELQDRGGGKLFCEKCITLLDRRCYEGIYKWDGDRLIISFSSAEYGCPTSFQSGKQQYLLILHRVKPRK